jgi:serine phosphatase RsbU (regulator of sigma subunit)
MQYPKIGYTILKKNLINCIKIIFVLFSFSTSLSAQEVTKEYITISDTTTYFSLYTYLHYYNDEKGDLSINDILKSQFSDSLQFTQNTKYIWVYFDVKTKGNKEWLIKTQTKNNTLYTEDNGKWITYNSSDYLYSNRRFLISKFHSDTSERIYMQIIPYRKMKNSSKLEIDIKQKYTYEKFFLKDTIFYMLVVGITFGLFFYNLFLAISTKSYSYYLYSFSVFFSGLRFLLFSSLFKEFFIDYDYQSLLSNSCTSVNIIFYTLFSLAYFKEEYKNKWTKVIISLLLFHVLASSLHIYSTFYYDDFFYAHLGNLSIVSIFISLFVFSIYKAKKKALGSKGFLLANSFLVPIVVATVIVNIFADPVYTGYTLSFGSVIQLLLFSFALGSRFNLIEKQIAQKESEKLELEKNQILELQKLTAQKNLELEEKVINRTAKLQETNEEMQQLIEELDITNESLQNTFVELKFQHKKVTDSIYYANNIQEAILPNISKIQTAFSDLFVFFRPRDVVSGDFYWYMPLEDEKYLIGAFDCTGHGVPGAFMSMISYQILNEIVLVKKKIMPNKILDLLREKIYFSLKQNENSNRDGLDACLILVDKKEEKIYFSGAKNPLYYVKDDILETIKGDNLYIGGSYDEKDKFTLHTIPFHQKDTQFYLSSDGIQDQFGGEEDKKIMRKIFKDYLLKNSPLSSKEQFTFWNTFMTQWQGTNQQTDDMLLIGIRP